MAHRISKQKKEIGSLGAKELYAKTQRARGPSFPAAHAAQNGPTAQLRHADDGAERAGAREDSNHRESGERETSHRESGERETGLR